MKKTYHGSGQLFDDLHLLITDDIMVEDDVRVTIKLLHLSRRQ